jgi:hypothetical protein
VLVSGSASKSGPAKVAINARVLIGTVKATFAGIKESQ